MSLAHFKRDTTVALSAKTTSGTWAQAAVRDFEYEQWLPWRGAVLWLIRRTIAEAFYSWECTHTRACGAIRGRSVDVGIISGTRESIFNGADLQTLRHTRWVSSPRSSFFDAHVEQSGHMGRGGAHAAIPLQKQLSA